MRAFHTALLGTAALLCAGLAAHAQQNGAPQAVAAVAPPSDAAPTADMPASSLPASSLPASNLPVGAQPATPAAAPSADAKPAAQGSPASKPAQKSASLTPKPKVYQRGLVQGGPDMSDQDTDGVAAVVNDISVSEYEVRQRLNLVLATSGVAQPKEEDL